MSFFPLPFIITTYKTKSKKLGEFDKKKKKEKLQYIEGSTFLEFGDFSLILNPSSMIFESRLYRLWQIIHSFGKLNNVMKLNS